MLLHIIYTESDMLLSRKQYASWREIQDAYATYKASLGPWDHLEVISYLSDEYPDLSPSAEQQVKRCIDSEDEACPLSFAEDSSPPNKSLERTRGE